MELQEIMKEKDFQNFFCISPGPETNNGRLRYSSASTMQINVMFLELKAWTLKNLEAEVRIQKICWSRAVRNESEPQSFYLKVLVINT